jgi:hypothetical protein
MDYATKSWAILGCEVLPETNRRRRVKLVEFANKQSYSFDGSFEKQHDKF